MTAAKRQKQDAIEFEETDADAEHELAVHEHHASLASAKGLDYLRRTSGDLPARVDTSKLPFKAPRMATSAAANSGVQPLRPASAAPHTRVAWGKGRRDCARAHSSSSPAPCLS